MKGTIPGIHHVTAIAGDPQRTLDFYAGLLGLRLVKLTVNYDDPGTYHLYFGDEAGEPGTVITFFPWPGALRGRIGAGQAAAVAFAVPAGGLGYWAGRLGRRGLRVETGARFGEELLAFNDPAGLRLELVGRAGAEGGRGRENGPVPPERAVLGVHGVTVIEEAREPAAGFLTRVLGFGPVAEEGPRARYACGPGDRGTLIDVVSRPGARPGYVSVGAVHHVAWRVRTGEEQRAWREAIAASGAGVTAVIDRTYFRSVYFREPGGVLFEIATDGPGFAVDEPVERLGTRLRLPPWLEDLRARVERELPPLRLPEAA